MKHFPDAQGNLWATAAEAVAANIAAWPIGEAAIHLHDCIDGMALTMRPESVDLTVTSIPFANLFMYSGNLDDLGNSKDDGTEFVSSHFGLHMRFFVEQLYRVHKPGTVAAIHVQQLLTTKAQHGFIGRREFRGQVIELFTRGADEANRWQWVSEFVIPKNVRRVAREQNQHQLMYVTGYRNGRKLAPYVNDYVLLFMKPGESEPVRCLYDGWRLSNPGGWILQTEWNEWARGVWADINDMDVLETRADLKEDEDRHVCPLQREVVRRLMRLYSNAGDLVLDPFMGIGTTAVVAVEDGRNAVGFELKESWQRRALRHVAEAREQRRAQPAGARDLFVFAGVEVANGTVPAGTVAW